MPNPAVGLLCDVEAHGTALGGTVVARLADGRVCFIAGGIPGERLRVRITAIKRSFAEAELVEVLRASPDRVSPPCAVFGACGGCQYQHVAYARQVALKAEQLCATLQRLGGVRVGVGGLDELHAAPSPWAYRNRIALHAAASGGFGYTDGANRTVIPITACPLARSEISAEIPRLSAGPARVKLRWSPGDGLVVYAGETVDDLPWRNDAVAGLPYRVPTGSFAQVNPEVAELLFALVGRWIAAIPAQRVIDAYCGAGFLGLAVTDRPVCGLELDPRSLVAATANAAARGLASSHVYIAGDVDRLLAAQLETAAAATCLILDPPRAGCGAATIATISRRQPGWILYVSCEPSTLARDLKLLLPAGYRVVRTALLDMFPHTAHFETVVLLEHVAVPGGATAVPGSTP